MRAESSLQCRIADQSRNGSPETGIVQPALKDRSRTLQSPLVYSMLGSGRLQDLVRPRIDQGLPVVREKIEVRQDVGVRLVVDVSVVPKGLSDA